MRTITIAGTIAIFLLMSCITGCYRKVVSAVPQPAPRPEGQAFSWKTYDLGFRVTGISSVDNSIWICGADETIASSTDDGAHWDIKHQTRDGKTLSSISFPSSQFGFSAGADGLILMTLDGGKSWTRRSGLNDTILQVSFADPKDGLVRIPRALLFTGDGGLHWTALDKEQLPEDIEHFPYTFSLVSLDREHMAAMMKEGPAQFYAQTFLFTKDSGKTWKSVNIPHVTLYSFLQRDHLYWAIGTEVIDRDRPDGGRAVPVALYSSDGENWGRFSGDLSSCRLEMCTLCNTEGCLSSNGVVTRIFSKKTALSSFSPDANLTTKWAATDSAVCFVDTRIHCTELSSLSQPPRNAGGPVPTMYTPEPLHFYEH